jgi:DNA helicase-2/ATP-dependent DNA helicase PcrA
LVDDELPGSVRDSKGWLSRGELPYVFRGDRETLPDFAWRGDATRKEAIAAFGQFADDVKAHRLAEDRRLMYVALTRAKHHVVLSGSFWAHQHKPRTPSLFLREASEAGLLDELPLAPASETPPEAIEGTGTVWPRDPLGTRREVVTRAAALVEKSMVSPSEPHDEAVRLLAARRELSDDTLVLPVRLPASSLEHLARDPKGYARQLARPLPRAPHQAALLGTLFHSYVEQRLGSTVPGPLVDVFDRGEEPASVVSFDQWKQKFEASEFAHHTPVAIETELHVPLAGHLIICKIDAVFDTPTGVRIIDWKTGKKPATPEEVEAKSIQLAAYRVAWSEWSGMPLEQVQASFWFVEDEALVTPDRLLDRGGLERIVAEAELLLG